MFEVNFSEQSMRELNRLDPFMQMTLIEKVSGVRQEQLEHPGDELGCFQRGGRTYYRVRAGDFRIYFEARDQSLYAHYILPKNSLTDFLFRFKMPVKDDFIFEQSDSFWDYLESLRKNEAVDDPKASESKKTKKPETPG
jgi:mRNA-degrading endonuclease RelE of RelBE toxin-antitoxin system